MTIVWLWQHGLEFIKHALVVAVAHINRARHEGDIERIRPSRVVKQKREQQRPLFVVELRHRPGDFLLVDIGAFTEGFGYSEDHAITGGHSAIECVFPFDALAQSNLVNPDVMTNDSLHPCVEGVHAVFIGMGIREKEVGHGWLLRIGS